MPKPKQKPPQKTKLGNIKIMILNDSCLDRSGLEGHQHAAQLAPKLLSFVGLSLDRN